MCISHQADAICDIEVYSYRNVSCVSSKWYLAGTWCSVLHENCSLSLFIPPPSFFLLSRCYTFSFSLPLLSLCYTSSLSLLSHPSSLSLCYTFSPSPLLSLFLPFFLIAFSLSPSFFSFSPSPFLPTPLLSIPLLL